jgi:hypothetical protein
MGNVISVKGRLRLVPHNGMFFFVSSHDDDAELGEQLTFFEAYVRRFDPALVQGIDPRGWLHFNVVKFLETVRTLSVVKKSKAGEFGQLISLSADHAAYFDAKCEELGAAKLPNWLHGLAFAKQHPAVLMGLLNLVQETIDRFTTFAWEHSPDLVAEFQARSSLSSVQARAGFGVIEDHVPQAVLDLRTEATLPVIRPWFEQSLKVAGDIAEFGCFKGTLSIKYAFYVRALGQAKTVYAFDTFEGFQIADPGGGALGVGAYQDNDNAYEELRKWGRVLPLVPVKGDATETCKILTGPLSFVWLDLDMAVFMEPVLRHILSLCGSETILGVDDYGRPETPTVKPWADETERRGVWTKVREYPETVMAFYRMRL